MTNDLFADFSYICLDIFHVYTVYRFMRIFLGNKTNYGKYIEIGTYIIVFLISTIFYFNFNIPIINMLITFISYIFISINYSGTIIKKVFTVLFIYLFSSCIETILISLSLQEPFHSLIKLENFPVATNFLIKTLLFFSMILMNRLIKIRDKIFVPKVYWLLLIPLPLSAAFMIFLLYSQTSLSLRLSGAFVVLLINLIMIFLYDILAQQIDEKAKQLTKDKEMHSFNQQLEIIQSNLNYWNHMQNNFRDNIVILSDYLGDDIRPEVRDFIDGNFANFFVRDNVNSGVAAIDSIMNYKIRELNSYQIMVTPSMIIPRELVMDNVDVLVIINGLFTYAKELVLLLPANARRIDVKIQFFYSMHRLVFTFSMPFLTAQKNCMFVPTNHFDETINKYLGVWSIKDNSDDTSESEKRKLCLVLFLNKKHFMPKE